MDSLTSNQAVYEVQEGMDRDLNKQFRVTDTRTDSRVATCYVQSNADLVCAALNAYTADEPADGYKFNVGDKVRGKGGYATRTVLGRQRCYTVTQASADGETDMYEDELELLARAAPTKSDVEPCDRSGG